MRILLVAAVVACGGGGDDGTGFDAPISERGPVIIHVVDKLGVPVPDISVVFIDTDMTQTVLVTDASGSAQADVFAGASVTAERASGTGCAFSLTTLLGLVPGDDLTLISAPSSAPDYDDAFTVRVIPIDDAPAGNFTIKFSPSSGATGYRVYTPCGPTDVGTVMQPTLPFQRGCASSPMDIIVLATSATGLPLKYAEQTGVPFVAGGNVTVTDSWHDLAAVSASYMNTTSRVTRIELERYGPYVRGLPITVAAGPPSGNAEALMMMTAASSTATMKTRFLCANGSGPDCVSSGTGVAQQTIAASISGTTATYAIDVAGSLLPWISGDYNPDTTTMEVTATATAVVDVYEGNLRYYRKNAPAACNNQYIYTWRVFGPIATSVTFPKLPSTLPGDPNPKPTDTQSAYQLYLCDSDAIGGYREAIKNVYETLGVCEMTPTLMSRPVTKGMVNRISQWN